MWTDITLASETSPAAGNAWRILEHQYTFFTHKVVDTQEEWLLLEELLEENKPRYSAGIELLHYLQRTPIAIYPHPLANTGRVYPGCQAAEERPDGEVQPHCALRAAGECLFEPIAAKALRPPSIRNGELTKGVKGRSGSRTLGAM